MDTPMDSVEESPASIAAPGNMERRAFLTRAAAAGALAWAAPVILSRPAYAVEGGEGSPNCIPAITVTCVDSTDPDFCGFPGIRIAVEDCPCADPAQSPTVCARIDGLTPGTLQAYANATACNPNDDDDLILSTGNWECIDPTLPILFAPPRDDPDEPPDNFPTQPAVNIDFTLGVWAGNCPPEIMGSPGDLTYNCQTFDVSITVPAHPNGPLVISSCNPDPLAVGLCDDVGADSPCGSC